MLTVVVLVAICLAEPPKAVLFVETDGAFYLSLHVPEKKGKVHVSIDQLGDYQLQPWSDKGIVLDGHIEDKLPDTLRGEIIVSEENSEKYEVELVPIWLPPDIPSLRGHEELLLSAESPSTKKNSFWKRLWSLISGK